MAKKEFQKNPDAEKRHIIGRYYIVVGIYTLLVTLGYTALRIAYNRGYLLINTSIQYWMWFALVIGVILLLGRLLANLPKNAATRKGVKVVVSLASICMLFLMYLQCVSAIDTGFFQYAELTDGDRDVILMRANLSIEATETAEAKQYTLYKAYPRVNRWFCDIRNSTDMIWLKDDPDATVDYEWGADYLKLYTSGSVMEDTTDGVTTRMDTIYLNLQ